MLSDDELRALVTELLDRGHHDDQFQFRGLQYDLGLAWVHFPVGKGGLGLSGERQVLVDQMLRQANLPWDEMTVNLMGTGMAAPTILTYGTDEMHYRYLRPIFTGEEIWCQLFSEPTHGSDVAGISCRAVRDGDEWVVNGQKVWTSLAHIASFGLLLTRTNPDVPKHAGLSYFILDMRTPGVEIRPLIQLTGEAEFNEVYLVDVRVPDAHMLGSEGDGWKVALTTLMNERVALGGGGGSDGKDGPSLRALLATWSRCRDQMPNAIRQIAQDRIASLWIRAEVLRLTTERAKALAQAGAAGPDGSIAKLAYAELNQAVFETCVDLLGAEGMLHEAGYPMARPQTLTREGAPSGQFLRSRSNTIEGGTSEIMRNILGERVLGLPGDARVDKNVPWSEIPRGSR